MKTTIKELRKIIRESLREMKLGVADPNPPGRYFEQPSWENDEEDGDQDLEATRQVLAQVTKGAFEPSEDWSAANKMMPNIGNWDEDQEDDDVRDWVARTGQEWVEDPSETELSINDEEPDDGAWSARGKEFK